MEEEIKKAIEKSEHNILEAISIFSTNMDKRFDGVETRLDGVETRLIKLENEVTDGFSSLRSEISEVKREIIARIEKLEKRDKEDTDALTQNYFELETRVKKLEQKLQQLQTA